MSTLTKIRFATAISAIAAAATLTPAAIGHATPAAPLPMAGVGSSLGSVTITPCDPSVPGSCQLVVPAVSPSSDPPIISAPPFVWLGTPGNPNYQPLFGIAFPNFFGLDFEACAFGLGTRLGPYNTDFVGLSLGC
jgi:hypothetical protein